MTHDSEEPSNALAGSARSLDRRAEQQQRVVPERHETRAAPVAPLY